MQTFHDACRAIITAPPTKALNYAIGYARHGLSVRDPHEMKVQALYLLNNISHWRGDTAKQVRETLKRVAA